MIQPAVTVPSGAPFFTCYTCVQSLILWLYVSDGQSVCLGCNPVSYSNTCLEQEHTDSKLCYVEKEVCKYAIWMHANLGTTCSTLPIRLCVTKRRILPSARFDNNLRSPGPMVMEVLVYTYSMCCVRDIQLYNIWLVDFHVYIILIETIRTRQLWQFPNGVWV